MLIRWVLSSIHTWTLLLPNKSGLQPIGPSSRTRHGWISLPAIVQYSSLLPPVGVWTVSQFQCGGPSSQNPYPSSVWWAVTPPTAQWDASQSDSDKSIKQRSCGLCCYGVLHDVSIDYPPLSGMLLTRYSPFRRSPPKYCYLALPLDLHVLSLPLAFILSQDQTLHCIFL